MKFIPLHPLYRNQFAIVDDEDYEWLNQWRWKYQGGYAVRLVKLGIRKYRRDKMHRMIMPPPEGFEIDHKNRNRADNRRENLRICTRSQNIMNETFRVNNKYGLKGVYFKKKNNKFCAQIGVQQDGKRKNIYLGLFLTPQEAHNAYAAAAIRFHGEFACL